MNYSQHNNKKRLKRYRSHVKKVKNKVGFIIFRVLVSAVLIGSIVLAAGGIGAYLSIIEGSPSLEELSIDLLDGSFDTVILDAHGNEIARLDGGTNRIFVPWDEISQYLKDAFVAIEDERFFEHNGASFPDMIRAAYQTVIHGNLQGASTITQQVVKMDLAIQRNNIQTKLQEQHLAIQYEAMLVEELGSVEAAKQHILHRYLNMVPLGHGQEGVEAAAWRYFNKPASEITLSEAVVIAAITSNPTARSPIRFPDWNRERAMVTLDNMLRLGMITEEQHREAYNDDVYARIQQVSADHHADGVIWHSFTDAVVAQLTQDFVDTGMTRREAQTLLFNAGLVVHTTMNPIAQAIVDAAFLNEDIFPTNPQDFEYHLALIATVENQVTGQRRRAEADSDQWGTRVTGRDMFDDFLTWAQSTILGMDDVFVGEPVFLFTPQPQSAMTIIDHNNGHVIAMAGQRGEKLTNRTTNRATISRRHPGSVFKIFAAYAPAFDLGLITAATGYDDSPNIIFDWTERRERSWPANWYRNPPYRGFQHVRQAIEDSLNVIAVKVIQDVSPQVAYNYLLRFGFTTILPSEAENASLALGGLTHGVTNIELTAAMGAIANGGVLHQPILYTRVYDRHGNILLDNTDLPSTQVISNNTAYLLLDAMRGVITRGTGPGARFQEITMDNAGKTGTTQEARDIYYTGSTPHLTASVWIGHDQPRPLTTNVTGSNRFDARIWRYVMEQIHIALDLEPRIFERPPGFVTERVCGISGNLPVLGLCDGHIRTEIFAPGTVPVSHCHVHREFEINAVTGMIPCAWCPPEQIERRVGIVRDRSPWIDIAGNVSIRDAYREVPQAVLDGIVCDVCTGHGGHGAGTWQDGITVGEDTWDDWFQNWLGGGNNDETDFPLIDNEDDDPLVMPDNYSEEQ